MLSGCSSFLLEDMSKYQKDLIVLECANVLTDLASKFPKYVGKFKNHSKQFKHKLIENKHKTDAYWSMIEEELSQWKRLGSKIIVSLCNTLTILADFDPNLSDHLFLILSKLSISFLPKPRCVSLMLGSEMIRKTLLSITEKETQFEMRIRAVESILELVSSGQNNNLIQSKTFLLVLLLQNWPILHSCFGLPSNFQDRFKTLSNFIFQRLILKELQKSNLTFLNSIDESSEQTVRNKQKRKK